MSIRPRRTAALVAVFFIGVIVGGSSGPPTYSAQDKAPATPYGKMLNIGIVVKDLDQAVAKWRALGFTDIRILPPSKGVDRTYHGKPIGVTLKQAFIRGTDPMIELMEPVGDAPNPWGGYLKQHGEVLHHVAYRVPDTGPELEKYRKQWGTCYYFQALEGGAVIEFISRIPRR